MRQVRQYARCKKPQNIGDRTEPWRVPVKTPKQFDLASPHFTQAVCSWYTNISTLITIGGNFLSESFWKRAWKEHLSKAFVQSSRVTMQGVPFLRKWLATSITNQLHCVVLVPDLNPNCKESVSSLHPREDVPHSQTTGVSGKLQQLLCNYLSWKDLSSHLWREEGMHKLAGTMLLFHE